MMLTYMFHFGLPGNIRTKEQIAAASAADLLCCFEVLNTDVSWTSNVKNIDKHIPELKKNSPFYLYCKAGYRSVVASSLINRVSDLKLINVEGGYDLNALAESANEHVNALIEFN